MPIRYKIDILKALKEKGYSSYTLAQKKHLSGGSIQKLRNGEILNSDGIATICKLLNCQPGDILVYEGEEN